MMIVVDNNLPWNESIHKNEVGKIYINTMSPKFKYCNSVGEIVEPKNCGLFIGAE